MPKLRQNIITGEWVVISPERAKRPEDFVLAAAPKRPTEMGCPFCMGTENSAYKESIKEAETENIYVMPNLYPAFVTEDEIIEEQGDFYPSYKSLGKHEVIVLKDHQAKLHSLTDGVFTELLGVYQKRIIAHFKNPLIEYSLLIHNQGAEAAASIEHTHSQLFSPSIVPSYPEKELRGSLKYFKENKKCVFCKLLEEEKRIGVRVLEENEDFLAFTFFASRFPFEAWIVPKRHSARFETATNKEKSNLAATMKGVLSKLYRVLHDPPFNFYIHTAPKRLDHTSIFYHWHIEILPRLSKFGGYELGSGMVIDVVSPEHAAEFLRASKS